MGPWGSLPPPPWPPPLSSVQPLLVTVKAKRVGTKRRCHVLLPSQRPLAQDLGEGKGLQGSPLSQGPEEAEVDLDLCLPLARAPWKTMPVPEKATLPFQPLPHLTGLP